MDEKVSLNLVGGEAEREGREDDQDVFAQTRLQRVCTLGGNPSRQETVH